MSQLDKLIKELENNPTNARFEDIKKLLERVGYVASNNATSHWQFRKLGKDTITIPYKKPVKACYVKTALKAIKGE
ncbi:type II toxin-antitoxin system HicA family toxin [Campylobacter sp. 19-13652]|uniref:type II toxin-antitoxin system HicA family toxin n=1 Tax=Campylobacter sp. 19-13652 TaxID=2840180 RepID=UPI001C751EB5|nr:type II toxin-antitoxin system HicA family toxin [Campylobacter sp. 19-13652]BCX79955.1 hypothetical protein LBC_14170 [Campylobacter sp. 19-13652]